MAHWSPWDTPKPAASPFNSKKVKESFEKYSSIATDDRFDFPTALDKPATVSGWYHDNSPFNSNNGKSFTSNNRSAMPSEISPSTSDGTDVTQSDFLTRYSQLKELEKYKNELIEELLCRYQFLTEKFAQLSADHDQQRECNRTAQRREKAFQDSIRRLQTHLDRDPFLLVLLDGDAIMFRDKLLKKGGSGGQEAAAMLQSAVLTHVTQTLPDLPSDVRIVVRVYLNLKNLANACHKAGVVDQISTIEKFALGFMEGRSLFDFVDVGNDRDAETKILDTFKLHLHDFRCRQIFLGCSFDNLYTRLLEKIAADEETLTRVTLLENIGFERNLRNLPFDTVNFSAVFRAPLGDACVQSFNSTIDDARLDSPFSSPNLPIGSQLSQMNFRDVKEFTPRGLPAACTPSVTSTSPKASPGLKWASIAARAAPAQPQSPQSVVAAVTSTSLTPRNRKGQRVDPMIKHDKAEVDRVKKLKMCNVHYLRGECPYGDNCTHIHNYKPTTAELQTLRLVARMAPCMNGSECDDIKCIYGHICPAPEGRDGKDCIFGEACRFPTDLHKIDRQTIKTTKV